MGLYNAGFDVTGVDLHTQPFYPFPFIQMSALDVTQQFISQFDYIHASPPCQALTGLIRRHSAKNMVPIGDTLTSSRPFEKC